MVVVLVKHPSGYNGININDHKDLGTKVKFSNVCLKSIGAVIPDEIWTSQSIEVQLEPVYSRLKLPEGRLELMSGIAERRLWAPGTMPSGPSILSANHAIEAVGMDRNRIGCLIHASVCRDFLEPATATKVHHGLGLSTDCWVYDISNACLGIINGAVQIAMMIAAGVIEAGIVVGTENSRMLLERTIQHLNTGRSLTRQSVKPAFASLTIGSGSCAWLLTHRSLAPDASSIDVSVAEARTEFHDLCQSDDDAAGAGMQPLMDTNSEQLMTEGIKTGVAGFNKLKAEWGREPSQIDRTVCHQVGSRHREAMLASMNLSPANDSITFPKLGNTGSVALPLTVAHAAHTAEISPGDQVAMLGIGSGINSVMLGVKWGETAIGGNIGAIEVC